MTYDELVAAGASVGSTYNCVCFCKVIAGDNYAITTFAPLKYGSYASFNPSSPLFVMNNYFSWATNTTTSLSTQMYYSFGVDNGYAEIGIIGNEPLNNVTSVEWYWAYLTDLLSE